MTATQYMQCMEVWGGNQAVDSGVIMAGLDAWAYSKPWGEDASGGDVHYVSSCASGRITRMLVADVSGHGNTVAQIAVRLRQLMRQFVNHLDQRKFVAELNNEFGRLAQDGRFATAVVCTFFAPTNHLTLSNAGHPPPMLWRARTRTWSIITPDDPEAEKPGKAAMSKRGLRKAAQQADRAGAANDDADGPANVPLGILDASRYDALTLRLNVGDLVMCHSDALIECHGRDGRMLGAAGLLEVANSIDMSDSSTFTATLLKTIESLAPGNLTGDDVTILLFRPNGLAPGLTWRERFAAFKRMTGAAARSLKPSGERLPMPDLSLPNIGGAFLNPLNRLWHGK